MNNGVFRVTKQNLQTNIIGENLLFDIKGNSSYAKWPNKLIADGHRY